MNKSASGCPISPDKLLTAAHVWNNMKAGGDITVTVLDPLDPKSLSARMLWINDEKDIALLLVEGGTFPKWFTMRKEIPKLGEELRMPLVNTPSGTGIVYGRMAFTGDDNVLLLDMTGFPGVSGACILDVKENLVAIATGAWYREDAPMRPFLRAVSVKEIK